MVEIRFHGRGGQGTVVASKILADAIAREATLRRLWRPCHFRRDVS